MGFLKRIFSIGSKQKKRQRPEIIHNVCETDFGVRPVNEDDSEAAVNRLLRSSSARYAVRLLLGRILSILIETT